MSIVPDEKRVAWGKRAKDSISVATDQINWRRPTLAAAKEFVALAIAFVRLNMLFRRKSSGFRGLPEVVCLVDFERL
jgi:hypothetical protein